MKSILVLGAGRSSTVLIDYLLENAATYDWNVTVADLDIKLAEHKIHGHPKGTAVELDIQNEEARNTLIEKSDVVVSLLPVAMHYFVVKDCIQFRKHVVTASYLSQEMYGLEAEVREAAILMVGEMGLDPGIDHMTAMQTIDRLKDKGCKINAFRSYTGGLIAPGSDSNPWHYKLSWNPRNVVLAGQGTAQYVVEGKHKYIPYNRVFRQTETINVNGVGDFEAYVNRDSLLYRKIYNLEDIPTLIRYTLRYPGYCRAWDALVQLGWTDDTYPIIEHGQTTYRKLLESYLSGVVHEYPPGHSIQRRLADFLGIETDDDVIDKLEWLGIFEDKEIMLKDASPATILQHLLVEKWKLQDSDIDMVIMQHQFEYQEEGKSRKLVSSLCLRGSDSERTAMAKLVGLPIGVFVKLILTGQIKIVGVHIPVIKQIYEPVLKELTQHGVVFDEVYS